VERPAGFARVTVRLTDRAVDVPKTHCDVSDVIWAAALILSGGLIFALPGA